MTRLKQLPSNRYTIRIYDKLPYIVILMILATVSLSSRALNLSFSENWAFWRNDCQIIRILEKEWGTDSLTRIIWEKPIIEISAALDSMGHIRQLKSFRIISRDIDRNALNFPSYKLNPDELKHLEQTFIENKAIITKAHTEEFPWNMDSIEPIVDRFYSQNKDGIDVNISCSLLPSFHLKSDAILITEESIQQIVEDFSVYPTDLYCLNLNYQQQGNTNEARLLLSMIYAFGDYRVNRWLDDFKFEMVLSIDDDGYVNAIKTIEGNSPLNEVDQQTLLDFMRYNNIEFSADKGSESDNIRINFPGSLFDETISSEGFKTRMNILEAKVRDIIQSTRRNK